MAVQKVLLLNQATPVIITGGFAPKGAYNNATDYAVGDSVDYLGSSYVMFNNAAAGNLPTDTAYWQVLANKGDDGLTTSVNGVTQVAGAITIDTDDISDTTATNKFTTAGDISKLAGIEAGAEVNNISDTDATDLTDSGATTLHKHSYSNLDNLPTLGTAAATAATDYATAAQGSTADTAVQPGDLSTVATTGAYSDLSGTPTIPDELSDLSDDSTHRLVTDTEKSTWNAKQPAGSYLTSISGQDLSTADNTTSAFITAGDIPAIPDSVDDLSPTQSGQSGKFLKTDGTNATWESIPGGGDMLASVYDPAGGAEQVAFASELITDHTALTSIGTNTHAEIDTKLAGFANDRTLTKEPTGFTSPVDVVITYDSTTQKITLTGTVVAYYRGTDISIANPTFVSGWKSTAHSGSVGVYFLYFDGTNFVWGSSFPDFSVLQIAVVNYRAVAPFGNRECHGFLPWESHKIDHYNIGTYRSAGGGITNVVPASTTADNRRPIISECTINDEDCTTVNATLTSKKYSLRSLSSTDTIDYTLQSDDIVALSTARPYYNSFTSPNFGQTLMPSNSVMTVWLYEVPATADAASQEIRHVFVQGQSITQATSSSAGALVTARNTEKLKTPLELNLGLPAVVAAEYVCIHKFIIQYSSSNWTITDSIVITGSRSNQVGSPAGNYLTAVTTDTTLTGDGSVATPLSVATTLPGTAFTGAVSVGTEASGQSITNTATLGAEMVPSFAAGNWTATNGWAANTTTLDRTTNATAGTITPSGAFTVVAGRTYKVVIVCSASSGLITYTLGSISGTTITATTITNYITATDTTKIIITANANTTCTITSISVKEQTQGTGELRQFGDILLAGEIRGPLSTGGISIDKSGFTRIRSFVNIGAGLTVNGAIAMTGQLTGVTTLFATTANMETTTSPGVTIRCNTAATSGIPIRISPSHVLEGTAWNTTPTAASKVNAMQEYMLPTTGATTAPQLIWANHTVNGVADTNERMRLTSDGSLTVTGATTQVNLIKAAGNINNYAQLNVQNASTGNTASSDIVATCNDGNETTNFVNMGINGSGYSNAGWTISGARDTYVYASHHALTVGTATAAKDVVIHTGGTLAANERLRVSDTAITASKPILVDTISEKTSDAGVTIDSLTIKDNTLPTVENVPILVDRQNKTSNSSVIDQKMKTGWGQIEGNATAKVSIAISFDAAFTSVPLILINFSGARGSSATNYEDLNVSPGANTAIVASTDSVTVNGFNANIHRSDSTALSAGTFYGFTWMAIGVVSR